MRKVIITVLLVVFLCACGQSTVETVEPTPAPSPTSRGIIASNTVPTPTPESVTADRNLPADEAQVETAAATVDPASWRDGRHIIINTQSMKYHLYADCQSLKDSDDSAHIQATGMTREECEAAGYSLCGFCGKR